MLSLFLKTVTQTVGDGIVYQSKRHKRGFVPASSHGLGAALESRH